MNYFNHIKYLLDEGGGGKLVRGGGGIVSHLLLTAHHNANYVNCLMWGEEYEPVCDVIPGVVGHGLNRR